MASITKIIEIAKEKTIKNYYNKKNENLIKTLENFCYNNNNILEFEKSINFQFIIYSINPFIDSNNLINILYKNNGYKFIILQTKITNTELSISINNQRVIYFKLLFIPNDIVFNKLEIKKQDNKLLEIPEIVMILDNINQKCELSNIITNSDENNIDLNIINNFVHIHSNKIEKYKNYKSNYIKNLIIKNLLQFIITLDIILLDYYSINNEYYNSNNNYRNYDNTIQIIYQNNIITEIKNKINEILLLNNISGDIIINTDRTYIINNSRLKKTLIYISIYNKKYKSFDKINIINCFNELSYNILPVLIKDKLVPHPFILIKYLIINIIYILLYSNNNNINFAITIKNLIDILQKAKKIDMNDYKFIGIYKNEELDLQIHQVYRPAQYFLKNNKLREI